MPTTSDSPLAVQAGQPAWAPRLLLSVAGLSAVAIAWAGNQSLPGCGDGCGQLGQGQFSHLLGLSVGWLGAIIYAAAAALGHRSGIGPFLRAVIVAAALWFVGVQVAAHQYCLWCCAVHGVAVLGALLLRPAASAKPSWPSSLVGLAAVAAMASVQWSQSARADASQLSASIESPVPSPALPQSPGKVSLHDGRFTLEVKDFPRIGSAEAPAITVALTDYTCGHCYHLKKSLQATADKAPGKVCALLLPASRNDEGRDVQRYMRLLWKIDPAKHDALAKQMAEGKLDALRPAVQEAVSRELGGKDFFEAALARFAPEIDETLATVAAILRENEKVLGTANLPQYIAGGKAYVGAPSASDELLSQMLGSYEEDPNPLVLEVKEVDFGRLAAGTRTNYGFGLKNKGPEPITLQTIRAPAGITVIKQPSAPIPPNSSAQVVLQLAFPNTPGDFEWQIDFDLAANDVTRTMKIKGQTWEAWKLSAPQLRLKLDAPAKLSITLAEPLSLSLPVPEQPGFKLKLQPSNDFKVWSLIATPDPAATSTQPNGFLPIAITSLKKETALPEGWPPAFTIPYNLEAIVPTTASSAESASQAK